MSYPVARGADYGPDAIVAADSDNPETTVPAPPTEDQVNARFLQFLLPVAATVANTFGSQIGSAVGGLVGGSSGSQAGGQIGGTVGNLLGSLGGGINLGGLFGGRSIAATPYQPQWNFPDDRLPTPAVDLTGPLLQHCTMQCINKITPELAGLLHGIAPALEVPGNGSRSATAEIEAVERFWPDVAAFLTQQVATHLPSIIKTVTSTVVPLLGSRAPAEIPPVLTGTEAHARWFVPVLTAVLTAVQQNLPQLIDAVTGKSSRGARDTAITWKDLSTYGRFWDNDFIQVVGQDNASDPNNVEIVLELASHLSWAKEIQIRDDNGALIKRLHVQDASKWDEGSVAAHQILTNGSLLFAKAKMFGFMTGMYVLPTAGVAELKGKRTHVRWMAD